MSKAKKPTAAQHKILQQLNEDICILKEPSKGYLPKSIAFYNYTHYKYQHTGSITSKTLELLIFHEWVKIDHSKSNEYKHYYFITEKGKAAANGKNKAS